MESTRQKKISRLLLKDLSEILRRDSAIYAPGGMISVSEVRISPDLGIAKVYLSFFPTEKAAQAMKEIELHNKNIRHELSQKVKLQLRKVPELLFFQDNTLDNIQRIDDLLNQ